MMRILIPMLVICAVIAVLIVWEATRFCCWLLRASVSHRPERGYVLRVMDRVRQR
jgi:hypothetical protein